LTFTLYSKPGCHLCDEMKVVVRRVMDSSRAPIALEEIDITTDADLESRYGIEIPVLLVDGKKTAKYRIAEAELKKIVDARS
jgi:hypothetical protein